MKSIRYILTLVAIVTLFTNCGEEEATQETIRPIRFAEVINSKSGQERTFSGVAQSSKETKLSFKVSGKISSLSIKIGDRVKQGQILATLDPIDYNIQLEQAKAQQKSAVSQEKSSATQIKSAEANLIATRSTYERIQKLYEANSVSLSEYEQSKAGYDAAQAQYDAAVLQHEAAQTQVVTSDMQVKSANNQVNYTKLYAPFNGVITNIGIEANEIVGSGSVIAVLSTVARPEVTVGIPEAFISKIKNGDDASITFSAIPNQNFKGVVSEVAFSPVNGSTYPLTLRIDNPSPIIRPGMAADVSFVFEEKDIKTTHHLIVPAKAIGESGGNTYVFILKPSDNESYIAQKKIVTTGKLVKQGFIIKDGLKEGDFVATAGLKSLMDGMTVKLLK
jgi:RND family efflux transporter MFP subunit